MIYCFTLLLAFCSITYELLLGQALSALLGNTVLRYSVTIGLYLLSKGVGSIFAQQKVLQEPLPVLQRIELALTVIGGTSIIFLFWAESFGLPYILLSGIAHGLIIIIGFLTGFELPLLIEMLSRKGKNREGVVIGFDYLGAFAGTICFAFIFYPKLGMAQTAALTAFINSIVGLLLVTQFATFAVTRPAKCRLLLFSQGALTLVMLFCVGNADQISEYCINAYLGNN